VFGGVDDQWVPVEDLDTWTRHTSGECDVHMLPGGHFFVATERDALLRSIEALLGPHTSPEAELAPRLGSDGADQLDLKEGNARARIER
jgi:surfactin synthase thioesterase subunit